MSTGSRAGKRGQKAKETKRAFPLDWLDAAVSRSAESMDYTQATAKKLVDDFFWAESNLQQLLREIRGLGACMQDQRLQSNTELTRRQLAFWTEAFRLLPYFIAVLKIAGPEIVKRSNANKINKWFGILMLARLRDDMGAQAEALKHLHRLGWGIARNNSLHHPDDYIGWNSQVNFALTQQLEWLGKLSLREIYEHMVGNEFAVVSIAIRQRLLDEVKALCSYQGRYVSDDFLELVPSPEPSPEDKVQVSSFVKLLESPHNGLRSFERGIFAAVAAAIQDPDLPAMTVSQVKEEVVKRAASIRKVSPQQARKDLKKFMAAKDKRLEWFAQQLSTVSPRWKYAPSHPQKLPAGEVDGDD